MPFFINADLEITSRGDLTSIRNGFGEAVVEMGCLRLDDGTCFASFEINSASEENEPEPLIRRFCDLIVSLPPEAKMSWDLAIRRVIDLGYQSDDDGNVVRSSVSGETLALLSELGVDLVLTIYPLEGRLE